LGKQKNKHEFQHIQEWWDCEKYNHFFSKNTFVDEDKIGYFKRTVDDSKWVIRRPKSKDRHTMTKRKRIKQQTTIYK
jgi:hypothetical protein